MTAFPWKLFRNGQGLVFPEGARRYVSVDVEQIPGDGGVERAIDGSAVFMGSTAFRRHAVSMSCSGHTVAPVFDLWPNDRVELHAPVEFTVPGPVATFAYDPVAGSVYGVDEDDRRLPAVVSGRSVTSDGAVAIRYRPVMECIVVSRTTSKTQGRADAGWQIRLEDLSGLETDDEVENIALAPVEGALTFEIGSAFSLNLATLVTSTTGMAAVFAVENGAFPPGVSLNSAGLVSGTPTAAGVYVVSVRVSSGTATAVQTYAFFEPVVVPPEPTIVLDAVGLQSFVVGTAFLLALAPLTTIANSAAAATYSVVGGALPAGLSLNAASGVVSGTPTAHGAYAFTVQAALPTGQTARQTYAFYSEAPPDLDGAWAVLSGGTRQNWSDQGLDFQAEDFTASGVLTVEQAGYVRAILQGGGGGGGASSSPSGAGGGGAGQHFDRKIWLEAGTYAVEVAASAPSGAQGAMTSLTPISAPGGPTIQAIGGGSGANSFTDTFRRDGAAGGCGGGGAGAASIANGGLGGSAPDTAFGSGGGNGAGSTTASQRGGGGGGGFSSLGGSANTTRGAGIGGAGIKFRRWGGLNFSFAYGGGGGAGQAGIAPLPVGGAGGAGGTTGDGGAGVANTGTGGGGAAGAASGSRQGGAGASGRAIFITEV